MVMWGVGKDEMKGKHVLLTTVIDSKPNSFEKGADLRIIPAEVTEDGTLSDQETKKRRVGLKEFGAVNGENIDGSVFGNVLSLGLRRSIT